MKHEKLILIDGNSIANRAFYALPLLNNSKGQHTNAVYGFTTMLMRLVEEEKPTHFLVAFDAGKETFRHAEYEAYKGKREKSPPELSEQFPLIKEMLDCFGICRFELQGYEADDIIGTLTRIADEKGKEVLVVTGDKDMLQLASDKVTIALTRKGISEMERYDPQAIQNKYGLKPAQIIDLKGLMGDSSDNIPGIPGIGEKTGLKLLYEYGSVEEVLAHADELKGKLGERVRTHADDARMSKKLATIFREVPLELEWEDMAWTGYDREKLAQLFQELEFKSLLDKLDLTSESIRVAEQAELEWKTVGAEEMDELVQELNHINTVHIEVFGETPHRSEVVGMALADERRAWYVPFSVLKTEAAAPVRAWLADEKAEKRLYDLHMAKAALLWQDIRLAGVTFDVLLAAYLLNPTEAVYHTLSGLTNKYGLPSLASDEEVYGKGAKFKRPEEAVLGEHLCRKAQAIHALVDRLKQDLEQNGMGELFYELELPLAQVLTEMEKQGVKVETKALEEYGKELEEKLQKRIERIYELAGTEFNINSTKQLGEILFEKLGLPVIKKTKTGYSTDAEVLERLEPYHEIVSELLHYRQLAKLMSTYVEGLKKEIREDTETIHTYFRQTITATGRLSSQFPNLQNIPIRLEEGRKIRQIFVPFHEDAVILSADYSQIELRVLAHLSQDERLIEAFERDMDIHTKTAMDVFGVSEDEVDANMRRQAKAVNFGIIYGISDYGLSQNLNIPRKAAAQFIEQYFKVFQGVRRYMDEIVEKARRDGYVSTLLNRRRYLPEIRSSNYNKRSFAERTAMNTPIQGTAADVIKLAMVKMAERLRKEKLKSRMLLQVHDELVFEVPLAELDTVRELVGEVMENAVQLSVPLKVDISYGKNWYEAK